ncbi:MAG: DNA integrity scanning protein DisA nucleotide-binding domain protein [Candidatus Saliniplasma sp.]
MKNFVENIINIKRDLDPSKMILFTDSEQLMEELSDQIRDVDIIITTSKPPLSSLLQKNNVRIRKLNHPPEIGINVLTQAKDIVLTCIAEGLMGNSDRILFIISTDIDTILSFDIEDIGVANLKDKIDNRVDIKVLEAAFNIGSHIVREGKEGMPAGALLILGDANNVLRHTRDSIQDPLQGCKKENLNIKDRSNWNTVKEFSMLDGAFVIDEKGYPQSAGRYVMFSENLHESVEKGFGGRHLAAASITKDTRALAIVVSSEGPIRIYKDGKRIYDVNSI